MCVVSDGAEREEDQVEDGKGEQGVDQGETRGLMRKGSRGFQEPITSGKTAQNSAELDSLCSLVKTG